MKKEFLNGSVFALWYTRPLELAFLLSRIVHPTVSKENPEVNPSTYFIQTDTDTEAKWRRGKGQIFTLKQGRGGGIYFLNETSACVFTTVRNLGRAAPAFYPLICYSILFCDKII
jgi:hypothetical protein